MKIESLAIAVLILVLMEYGLWHSAEKIVIKTTSVLILVLMEYGLWQPDEYGFQPFH